MGDASKIEWTGATWNPVTGCTQLSDGCDHCYALTFAERWRGTPAHPFENGFDITLRPERLSQPLRWKRPRRIFVNSMSDLFHKDVPDEFIAQVFGVMAAARRHTFQVLTKRHGRMRSLLNDPQFPLAVLDAMPDTCAEADVDTFTWPVPNVWLGVSAENQKWADIRIPALLDTPAAVRFISAEPLLGPADFSRYLIDVPSGLPGDWARGLDWIICGGESGPGARRMKLAWASDIAAQCQGAGVPVFVKQLGSIAGRELGAGTKGGDWDAWPVDLRVREFPRAPEAVRS